MFSRRSGWDLSPNRLAREQEALQRGGIPLLDLTQSNPTRAGFRYPESWLKLLADPASLKYEPNPKGLLCTREAVASLYAGKGVPVNPERILLTAGTSEAYGFLFRLLADPGDEVLLPRPSYPLFDFLADLNDLSAAPYSLRQTKGTWELDFDSLQSALSRKTKAVVAVHPNNPTGSCLRRRELERLARICAQKGIPLITDEVFAEYRTAPADPEIPATLLGQPGLLTFALGGVSKLLGFPQMKLAWIAAGGPEEQLRPAMERLEMIADTTLSVNTPVQRAFPGWLKEASLIQDQIRRRIQGNRRFLEEQAAKPGCPFQLLPSDGGWSGVLRFPAMEDSGRWTADLLKRRQALVHPGHFFEFEEEGFIVVSLLSPTELFEEGIRRVIIGL